MIINLASGLGGGGSDPRLTSSAYTGVEYISSASTIEFYNLAGDVIGSIDASDFVIDGMVEDVYLSGTTLVIDFNTESGQQDIEIDLTEYFDPDLYYTSAQTDTLITNAKNDVYASATTYTDNAIAVIDLSAAVASAKTYTDGEISALTAHIEDVEQVTAVALNELNDRTNELSGTTSIITTNLSGINNKIDVLSGATSAITAEMSQKLDISVFESSDLAVSQAINDLNDRVITISGATSAITSDLSGIRGDIETISGATSAITASLATKVSSNDITTIVKMTQAQYDALSGDTSSTTLYVIISE